MADVFGRWGTPSFVNSKGQVAVMMRLNKQETEMIKSQFNDSYAKKQARIKSFFRRYAQIIYIGMCLRFATVAAKYTPPNIGKANIDKKYYDRPIQKLEDLAKGLITNSKGRVLHATKEDYAALRAGYKFKILNTKYKHKKSEAVFAYAKGINEAKRLARIQTRGLSKYSWGANLNNLKEDMQNWSGEARAAGDGWAGTRIYRSSILPPIFQRLGRKSPEITRFVWGTYNKFLLPSSKQVKQIKINILNRLTQIQRYSYIAIRKGSQAALKYASTIWKAAGPMAQYEGFKSEEDLPPGQESQERKAAKQLRVAIGKLFDDDVKKFGIQQLQLKGIKKGQHIFKNKSIKDINIIFK